MNETDTAYAAVGGDKIFRLDEAQLRDHLDRKITQSVEETLMKMYLARVSVRRVEDITEAF